eukprot:CAMPEP_0176499504 /NCGR_PEP_ID=MMETSP0200_2-20121128/12964_1 /TAXON_ID=947934 /ORGANISM="Chaetoceros sp., Strain GSL56" /LENGTH=183 /DNA_ID=CAMNT_0017897931 /DNA_START=381 /DNA_END=928 /DNA_ORIENTATION=-
MYNPSFFPINADAPSTGYDDVGIGEEEMMYRLMQQHQQGVVPMQQQMMMMDAHQQHLALSNYSLADSVNQQQHVYNSPYLQQQEQQQQNNLLFDHAHQPAQYAYVDPSSGALLLAPTNSHVEDNSIAMYHQRMEEMRRLSMMKQQDDQQLRTSDHNHDALDEERRQMELFEKIYQRNQATSLS